MEWFSSARDGNAHVLQELQVERAYAGASGDAAVEDVAGVEKRDCFGVNVFADGEKAGVEEVWFREKGVFFSTP